MRKDLRSPVPYDTIDKSSYQDFSENLRQRDNFDLIRDELSQIMGPLTVRERWSLLGDYGFEVQRPRIALEGPSGAVAFSTIDYLLKYGYPAEALLVQLIEQQGSISQGLANRAGKFLELRI